MGVIVQLYGHDIDPAVAHFAHRHQLIRKFADFACRTPQDDRFHAIVVIQMHVHR